MTLTSNAHKAPPRFTTYVDVDVDIDSEDLEAAGWQYVGKQDEGGPIADEKAVDVVRSWHDSAHPDPWCVCLLEPCDTLRGRWGGN